MRDFKNAGYSSLLPLFLFSFLFICFLFQETIAHEKPRSTEDSCERIVQKSIPRSTSTDSLLDYYIEEMDSVSPPIIIEKSPHFIDKEPFKSKIHSMTRYAFSCFREGREMIAMQIWNKILDNDHGFHLLDDYCALNGIIESSLRSMNTTAIFKVMSPPGLIFSPNYEVLPDQHYVSNNRILSQSFHSLLSSLSQSKKLIPFDESQGYPLLNHELYQRLSCILCLGSLNVLQHGQYLTSTKMFNISFAFAVLGFRELSNKCLSPAIELMTHEVSDYKEHRFKLVKNIRDDATKGYFSEDIAAPIVCALNSTFPSRSHH